jgi:hypothetical protein
MFKKDVASCPLRYTFAPFAGIVTYNRRRRVDETIQNTESVSGCRYVSNQYLLMQRVALYFDSYIPVHTIHALSPKG